MLDEFGNPVATKPVLETPSLPSHSLPDEMEESLAVFKEKWSTLKSNPNFQNRMLDLTTCPFVGRFTAQPHTKSSAGYRTTTGTSFVIPFINVICLQGDKKLPFRLTFLKGDIAFFEALLEGKSVTCESVDSVDKRGMKILRIKYLSIT